MINEGDKVLVEATVTKVYDDDPHGPSVDVWFNGNAHRTTIMNLRELPAPVDQPCSGCDRYDCDGKGWGCF